MTRARTLVGYPVRVTDGLRLSRKPTGRSVEISYERASPLSSVRQISGSGFSLASWPQEPEDPAKEDILGLKLQGTAICFWSPSRTSDLAFPMRPRYHVGRDSRSR